MRPLSEWASRESIRALEAQTSDARRLAIGLTPVRSVVRVIDPSGMTVDWAAVGRDEEGRLLSNSYTDFSGKGRIAVNPVAILENKLPPGEQVDVSVGFGMHEASHAKHSRDVVKVLMRKENGRDVPAFEPLKVAAWLLNLVEDVRIEAATSREWPGFAPYFGRVLDWMWDRGTGQATEYGPALKGKMKAVYAICRYPDRLAASEHTIPAPEIDWWKGWQEDYLAGRHDAAATVKAALDHLNEDPKTRKEMEDLTEAERKEREAGERLAEQIRRLMDAASNEYGDACTTGSSRELVSEELAKEVGRLIREGLVQADPVVPDGDSNPPMFVSKPSETEESRAEFIGRPDATVEAMRTALVFRSSEPRHEVKLQRAGDLDDEELWRWGAGETRLYTERHIEAQPDALMGMLVDMSGSMDGSAGEEPKIVVAQRLAQTMLWAAHDIEGVTCRVWGHTGDLTSENESDVYRLWEPGDPMSRLGLIASMEHGDNYDGHAIAYCADIMRREPEAQKVLFVLSDGYPAGRNYGDRSAQNHMRQVARWADTQGVTVIQIAIDRTLRAADQARMFGEGNFVMYRSDHDVARQLTRLMQRFTR